MSRAPLRRTVAASVAAACVAVLGGIAGPAAADTAPLDASTPLTVSADALPTVQINGVVWTQLIVGNTVYVGGEFTSARPAGSALGVNETPRSNLLAYNLTTGNLITSFNIGADAQVKDLAVSPDQSTLYIAGSFTHVGGLTRYRAAAIDIASQTVTSWRPVVNAQVKAISVSSSAVYLAGAFSNVNGAFRQKVAAVDTGAGTTTLPFQATVENGTPQAMVLAPDEGSVVIGGSFTSVDGSDSPGYGLARLDAATGAMMPLPVNDYIRDAGTESAVLSLETDGEKFYGSGYHFGGGGNMEGSFAADWATGSEVWVEDCHGDTYSAYPAGDAVYSASHKHYCGNSGGFPQTTPWTFYHATATTKTAERVNTADPYGYPDHVGEPSPEFLQWYPYINTGTYTGQGQGPWTVTGNDKYVLYGGEFTWVNKTRQQGLVRFAISAIAPNKVGPEADGAAIELNAASVVPGTVRIAWPSTWDRDNETLTYSLYRDTTLTDPVYTVTDTRKFWETTNLGFVDKGLTPGADVRYRLFISDPWGNTAKSEWVYTTVASGDGPGEYAQTVLGDNPGTYWRLGEPSGSTAFDWAGFNDGVVGTGVTRGAAGAVGDTDTASTFGGTTDGLVASTSSVQGPDTFTAEAWFKTTTTRGGKILGFGNAASGNSTSYDRHVYMTNDGRLIFGVYPGGVRTLASSASYNDGQWHQVVASLGSTGMSLFVDGVRVASRTDVTSGQAYAGYWRVGGDSLAGWTSRPSSDYFSGVIDDVSIYPTVLDYQTVLSHYSASGRVANVPPVPGDAYGAAVQGLEPTLYWRLGESSGTTAADTSWSRNDGQYRSGYTLGAPGALVGVSDTAVSFDGVSGLVSSKNSFTNPTVYSEELWFRTTTTVGGKLIGFGNAATGLSSSYDRHVYMGADGRLTFGVWTGSATTITSPDAYNDGQWHYLVATQSSAGMVLYVDGAAVASGPQTAAQSYTGYWRVGGDTSWGGQAWFAGDIDEVAVYPAALSASTVAQHYLLGAGPHNAPPTAVITASTAGLSASLDASGSSDTDGTVAGWAWDFGDGTSGTGETVDHTYASAGTYTVTLTVTDDQGATGTAQTDVTVSEPVNVAPTASFSASVTDLSASLDATASSDPDGTVVGWAWDFGDGTSGTGETVDHTYASAGTYSVTLTVTDDKGATGTQTQDVTATEPQPPNVAPTASFSASVTDLSASLDATASSDPDGTVVGWAWDFGDGTSGTGETVDHTYASAGTYSVTLTVTDDKGATGTQTQDVTVVAPNQAPVADVQTQVTDLAVAVDGTGSSDPDGTVVGWAWDFGDGATATGSTASHTYAAAGTYTIQLTVTDNRGGTATATSDVTVVAPNQAPVAAIVATPNDLTVAFDGSPSTDADGSVVGWAWDFGDGTSGSGATASHTYAAAGTYSVTLTVTDDKGATGSLTQDVTVAGPVNQPPVASFSASVADLDVAFNGSASSDPDGSVVAWAWDFGDGTSGTGGAVPHTYAAAGTYDVTLTVTDDQGATGQLTQSVTVTAPPVNQAPSAVFSSSASDLVASFDASGSSDPDGSVAAWAWSFGDGASGSGETVSHTYAAAGTYSVTLTVTDDQGATGTVTQDVTVTEPGAVVPLAQDAFSRTVSDGWGSATTGGPWSVSTASRFSVDGSAGLVSFSPGWTLSSWLDGVSSDSTEAQVTVSADAVPGGGGAYLRFSPRWVSSSTYYAARLKLTADGQVALHLTRGATAVAGGTVSGLTFAAGDQLRVRVQAEGTNPTVLRAKVWKVGDGEPTSWFTTYTDSTAALQVPGGIGMSNYLSGSSDPVVFSFDDLWAGPVG